jgi:hypothetical protein
MAKKANENGTTVYQRQHKRGLTMPQLNAIDLLASGKTDKATAELLGLSRTCVTKWRLYDPLFAATLNQRRTELWGAGLDRLRSLVLQALDTLGEALTNQDVSTRLKAASELLRLAQLPSCAAGIGPQDAEEIVRRIVLERRGNQRDPMDDIRDNALSLPPFEQHVRKVWLEMEALAAEPAGPATPK